jgi:hypothetical protein
MVTYFLTLSVDLSSIALRQVPIRFVPYLSLTASSFCRNLLIPALSASEDSETRRDRYASRHGAGKQAESRDSDSDSDSDREEGANMAKVGPGTDGKRCEGTGTAGHKDGGGRPA